MTGNAGIWIDHAGATVVFLDDGEASVRTIRSGVEGQHKATGHAGSPLPGHLGGGRDSKDARHRGNQLRRYYEQVGEILREVEDLLILGPGEAPGELRKQLEDRGVHTPRMVVEARDKLTEAELTAAVKAHFGHAAPRRKR